MNRSHWMCTGVAHDKARLAIRSESLFFTSSIDVKKWNWCRTTIVMDDENLTMTKTDQ